MRVVICSDHWEQLPAAEVTEAMARGWRSRQPAAQLATLPFSSGGTGFVRSLAACLPGDAAVSDRGTLLRDGTTDYLDGALLTASGSSAPLGAALARSIDEGARRIVVGVGDACGVDGGAGLVHAVGGSEELRTALPRAVERTRGVELVAAYREDITLLGLKGASASAVETLGWSRQDAQDNERRVADFAAEVREILPPRHDLLSGKAHRDDRAAGSGAGGGAGFALAVLGARLIPGADAFAATIGLTRHLAQADLVVAGTRVFDWRSLADDTVATVVRAAAAAALPSVILAREIEVGRREIMSLGASAAYGIVDPRSLRARAEPDGLEALTGLARRVAGTWSAS